jgi:hypothetical protein
VNPLETGIDRTLFGKAGLQILSAVNDPLMTEPRIHRNGQRNGPLTTREQAPNRQRSTIEVRADQVFAQHEAMGRRLVRTIGVAQAWLDSRAMNLAYNVPRVLFGDDDPGRATANEAPVAGYADNAEHPRNA